MTTVRVIVGSLPPPILAGVCVSAEPARLDGPRLKLSSCDTTSKPQRAAVDCLPVALSDLRCAAVSPPARCHGSVMLAVDK